MAQIEIAKSTDVREHGLFVAKAGGISVLFSRINGTVFAVENKCPHLGLSMARGSITGSTLQCPWHGSKFDMCTGKNIEWVNAVAGVSMPAWTRGLLAMGKQPAPVRTFAVSEQDGRISVDI